MIHEEIKYIRKTYNETFDQYLSMTAKKDDELKEHLFSMLRSKNALERFIEDEKTDDIEFNKLKSEFDRANDMFRERILVVELGNLTLESLENEVLEVEPISTNTIKPLDNTI